MIVLQSHTSTTQGNDCLIRKDISLVELNGGYSVISSTKYSGWMGPKAKHEIYDKEILGPAKELYDELIAE